MESRNGLTAESGKPDSREEKVAQALLARALGCTVTETRTERSDKGGEKTVTTVKEVPPDISGTDVLAEKPLSGAVAGQASGAQGAGAGQQSAGGDLEGGGAGWGIKPPRENFRRRLPARHVVS